MHIGFQDSRPRGAMVLSRVPLMLRSPALGYLVAVVLTGMAFVLRMALDTALPPGFPYVTFFPAVVAAAFLCGVRPGIVAGALGFFLSWYFFIAPVRSFGLSSGALIALGLYLFVVVVIITLIHWMQQANAQLAEEREVSRRLAENREVLFRELQHRVGNNLQMVGSVLALQKRKLTEPSARAAIDDAARRISLIGRIQRQLYDPDGAQIGLGAFLSNLARDIVDSSGRTDVICTAFAAPHLTLTPEQAIPTALVVAEAISNALEHGLADRAGTIHVRVEAEDGGLVIRVEDTGIGLPEGFTITGAKSLGLRLSIALASHHGGSFSLHRDTEVTVARLYLPLPA